jgi:hypothetical protein
MIHPDATENVVVSLWSLILVRTLLSRFDWLQVKW